MAKPTCEDCGKQLNKYGARWCKEHGYVHRIRPTGLVYKIVAVNKSWFKSKGGWINQKGYRVIKPRGQNQITEHRYIIEKSLNRKLGRSEVVHHINGDKLDNRLENLQLLTKEQHDKHHNGKSRIGVADD